jgi:hypothetical protein
MSICVKLSSAFIKDFTKYEHLYETLNILKMPLKRLYRVKILHLT